MKNLVDIPRAIGGLAPRWPSKGDVRNHSRRLAFARQAITGGPHQVAEQHVGMQVFFKGLSFEKRVGECIAQCPDCIGKHVVEHKITLPVCEN